MTYVQAMTGTAAGRSARGSHWSSPFFGGNVPLPKIGGAVGFPTIPGIARGWRGKEKLVAEGEQGLALQEQAGGRRSRRGDGD